MRMCSGIGGEGIAQNIGLFSPFLHAGLLFRPFRQPGLDSRAVVVGKKSVDIGVQVVFGYGVGPFHRGLRRGMILSAARCWRRVSRARDSLDMTVPSGIDSVSAAS
ncbi:hypothetical protein D3C72_1273290 [compost metagenome]